MSVTVIETADCKDVVCHNITTMSVAALRFFSDETSLSEKRKMLEILSEASKSICDAIGQLEAEMFTLKLMPLMMKKEAASS